MSKLRQLIMAQPLPKKSSSLPLTRMLNMLRILWGIQICMQNMKAFLTPATIVPQDGMVVDTTQKGWK